MSQPRDNIKTAIYAFIDSVRPAAAGGYTDTTQLPARPIDIDAPTLSGPLLTSLNKELVALGCNLPFASTDVAPLNTVKELIDKVVRQVIRSDVYDLLDQLCQYAVGKYDDDSVLAKKPLQLGSMALGLALNDVNQILHKYNAPTFAPGDLAGIKTVKDLVDKIATQVA